MPRPSIVIANLTEKERSDGSRYLIGHWHDLTLFVAEQAGGRWEARVCETKLGAADRAADRNRAAARGLSAGQAAALQKGNRARAGNLGARARVHLKIADDLDTSWRNERRRIEGVESLGGDY